MRRSRQLIASAVASLSLIAMSTAAGASTAPPPPSGDPWLALSMLTSSGSAGLAGAGAAAQPEAPPPAPPPHYGGFTSPPLPVIALWLGVIALDVYLIARNDHHGHPNSPA
jgi:hypothetical protein